MVKLVQLYEAAQVGTFTVSEIVETDNLIEHFHRGKLIGCLMSKPPAEDSTIESENSSRMSHHRYYDSEDEGMDEELVEGAH